MGVGGAGAGFVFGQALAAPLFVLDRRRNGRQGTGAQGCDEKVSKDLEGTP